MVAQLRRYRSQDAGNIHAGVAQRATVNQLHIPGYAASGMALHEEAYDCRPGESMTPALACGVGRARHLINEQRLSKRVA
ncbi:hypothetical protein [Pseudomonas putida]|uniref:hypothetical protein n=1 Tax=Pseudomonas putida TaxID=303 RepID=UPI003D6D405D